MSTKVLVFESDPAFAGELRNELGKLGCSTVVVDDGNIGLQQASANRPDLILLSIELPRMNGFSVCNKLKKDVNLKEVPLIIMSSESSDETFEQHKKLRTRAEDYVHKPIAFGELLRHIQDFVALGSVPQAESDAVIVIDDDIDLGSSDYSESDGTQIAARPAGMPSLPTAAAARGAGLDDDVDAFADAAFGRLTGSEPGATAEARPIHNGASEPTVVSPTARRISTSVKAASVRPPPGVDPAEHEKVRGQLEATKMRAVEVESALRDAQDEADKLRLEVAETDRLRREVEELKSKLAAGPKAGGISSRDFLDLREALNKKDKEILGLREAQSKKDREIVEGQERTLALERVKADVDDKVLSLERELNEEREKSEALSADKDLAKKANEDLRGRLEKAQAEGEARDRQLAELRAKGVEDRAAADVALVAAKAQHAQELEDAIEDAEAKGKRARDEALAAQAAKLGQEHDAQLGALQRSHQQAFDQAREEATQAVRDTQARAAAAAAEAQEAHASALSDAGARHTEALHQAEDRHAKAARDAEERHAKATRDAEELHADAQAAAVAATKKDGEDLTAAALGALRAEHAERVTSLENDRDSRVAALESKAARELAEAHERIARAEAEGVTLRDTLAAAREAAEATEVAAAARIDELSERIAEVSSARDALQAKLSIANDRVSTLEDEGAALTQQIATVEQRLGSESLRADRAHTKWDADRQSLDRAKDALAVALAQIEEAEGRAIS